MRCLTLARALTERGVECAFVESRAAAPILRRFGWPAQTLLAIADAARLADLVSYAGSFAGRFEPDVIVIDHYDAGSVEEAGLRERGRRIVVIDDLADRAHDCDLLVDPGYGRKADAYRGLVPGHARVLAGPAYALVRPEFAAARSRAMSRRAKHARVARGLVALGLTDVGGITARVAQALAPVLAEARLDVVVGAGAQSAPTLAELARADRRLRIWTDTAEMASLMADADVAIGAGGSSLWERAVVGLPAATVILAENQREMTARMAAAGLTLAIDAGGPDFDAQLTRAWRLLAGDPVARWRLAEGSSELCDGHGAVRVAEAILTLHV